MKPDGGLPLHEETALRRVIPSVADFVLFLYLVKHILAGVPCRVLRVGADFTINVIHLPLMVGVERYLENANQMAFTHLKNKSHMEVIKPITGRIPKRLDHFIHRSCRMVRIIFGNARSDLLAGGLKELAGVGQELFRQLNGSMVEIIAPLYHSLD